VLPLLLDTRGKRVVVFGGGEVGLRKARFFAGEAEVTVISRSFVTGFETLDSDITKIVSEIGPDHKDLIDGSDFVIIATENRELNDRLEAMANKAGKYCNRADGVSSFLIPSLVERRNFIVAISTLGRSPAMARYLKDVVEETLGPDLSAMIDLQEEMRERARRTIPDQASREKFLWNILGDRCIWDELAKDPGKAMAMAIEKMEAEGADDL
jgi:precorrin-2 dehydrogenase / sirohydrochlorin ferrochelatase